MATYWNPTDGTLKFTLGHEHFVVGPGQEVDIDRRFVGTLEKRGTPMRRGHNPEGAAAEVEPTTVRPRPFKPAEAGVSVVTASRETLEDEGIDTGDEGDDELEGAGDPGEPADEVQAAVAEARAQAAANPGKAAGKNRPRVSQRKSAKPGEPGEA